MRTCTCARCVHTCTCVVPTRRSWRIVTDGTPGAHVPGHAHTQKRATTRASTHVCYCARHGQSLTENAPPPSSILANSSSSSSSFIIISVAKHTKPKPNVESTRSQNQHCGKAHEAQNQHEMHSTRTGAPAPPSPFAGRLEVLNQRLGANACDMIICYYMRMR